MGKSGFLTPKAIANRIKAKGLQKLRWYCQLCQKQCRDENGFKCHQTSESHIRQMELFGQNADGVIDEFSQEFETTFVEHLARAHPHSRIAAQTVYNEFIMDKHHVHMNSTRWLTLTDFVKHLGRQGKCKVEETEKGWFVTLISVDPAEALAREKVAKRTAREEEEEERQQRLLDEQVKRARLAAGGDGGGGGGGADGEEAGAAAAATALERGEGDGPIKLSLAAGPGPASLATGVAPAAVKRPAVPLFGDDDDGGGGGGRGGGAGGGARKPSKVEELMRRDLEAKKRAEAAAAAAAANKQAAAVAAPSTSGGGGGGPWLRAGIVVKVMSKALKEHGYYKQKGTVTRVLDRGFVAEIELPGGDVVRVDQDELETVIPQPGGSVRVLRGAHAGARGTLREIDVDRFRAAVELDDGVEGGGGGAKRVWLDYEDVSKLASSGSSKR